MLAQITFMGLGVMLIAISTDLGFGASEAGWLGATRTVGQTVVFPLSFLAVRFGPKRLYGALTLTMGVAMLLGGLAPSFAMLLVSREIFRLAVFL